MRAINLLAAPQALFESSSRGLEWKSILGRDGKESIAQGHFIHQQESILGRGGLLITYYLYARTYVRMYVRTYVRTYVHKYVRTHVGKD